MCAGVEPGIVPVDEWWPSGPSRSRRTAEERLLLGGVGCTGESSATGPVAVPGAGEARGRRSIAAEATRK